MRGKAITIILLIITSQVTQATVNLRDASLIKSWIDIDGSEVKTSHLITRSYNSRSLSTGRFGFGWCSNLDLTLTLRSENLIELDECVSRQEFRAVVDKKSRLRRQWRDRGDVIQKIGNTFVVRRSGKDLLRFNLQGQLLEIRSRQRTLKLQYHFGSLVALSDRAGRLLHILSDSTSGRILRLEIGDDRLDYAYHGDDLIEVKHDGKLFSRMNYDSEHNLTRLDYADHSSESFIYDTTTDRLTGSVRRDGCRETYNYEIKNQLNFVSSAFENCGQRPKLLSQIEFFFRTQADGESYLEKTQMLVGGKNIEMHFNSELSSRLGSIKQSDAGGLE